MSEHPLLCTQINNYYVASSIIYMSYSGYILQLDTTRKLLLNINRSATFLSFANAKTDKLFRKMVLTKGRQTSCTIT